MFSLLLIVVFAVAACGNDENASENNNGNEDTEQNGDVDNGEGVFKENCASCHGDDADGDGSGPDLRSETDNDEVIDQVKNGGGSMPAFEDELSEEEIEDVAAYITEEVAD